MTPTTVYTDARMAIIISSGRTTYLPAYINAATSSFSRSRAANGWFFLFGSEVLPPILDLSEPRISFWRHTLFYVSS